MNYQNLFKIALRAIGANKMRSFLTALGIIIGIAAVITMLAIGQGSKANIKANIAEMGSNMIMISPGADMRGGVRQDASSMETLKQADYESIKEDCNYISAISPTVNSAGQWIYGNNNTQSSIYGVNQDYLSIRQLKVADGEMFTDADIKAAAKVCILGQTVVDYLFPDGSDPIGKVVRFNSIPFRVVGVLQKKGYNSMGMDQDDLVLAPYTTVMKRIMAQTYLGGIVCSAITEEASEPAQNQITNILRRNHKLKDATDTTEADDDDFNIRSQEEISSMMNSIYGVNQDYLSIRQLKVADGEMFTDADIKAAAKVCILGQTVVDYLFPDGSDPIGKVVRFNSIPFRVVGVLQKKGYNSMGMDQDDLVLAPYTTVMKRIMAQTYLGGIVCSAITEEASEPAQNQITNILRRNHKLKDATDTTEADDDDFNIRSQEEISSMMNSTMSTITILLGSVAGISLLVGGIGIMNIMYVSVTERTREIGLRMSVGARGIDILNQFLIEAILLSVTGGIIGVILGVTLSLCLNTFLHIATQIEPWSIIMSFAVCTLTGVFFGWYPAKKAARLDPIEAIRYE